VEKVRPGSARSTRKKTWGFSSGSVGSCETESEVPWSVRKGETRTAFFGDGKWAEKCPNFHLARGNSDLEEKKQGEKRIPPAITKKVT